MDVISVGIANKNAILYSTLSNISVPDVENLYTINLEDISYGEFLLSIDDTNEKTIDILNSPASSEIFIRLSYNATTNLIWNNSIKWETGLNPVFSSGNVYYIALFTYDSGENWNGMIRGGFNV